MSLDFDPISNQAFVLYPIVSYGKRLSQFDGRTGNIVGTWGAPLFGDQLGRVFGTKLA